MKIENLTITQVKSTIGRSQRQKSTMQVLGLRKINQTVVHRRTPAIVGMIHTVKHLITIR